MSRKLLAVAAFALIAPLSVAHSQLSFGVAAGASLPSGDLSDAVDMGYHAMGTIGFKPPLAPLGFRADIMFNEFVFKAPFDDTKLRILGGTANAVFSMPGAVVLSPYAIGGLGMYKSSTTTAGSTSESDIGFNIGAGVKFGLAGFGAFAEARFHSISGDGGSTRFIPVTFGIVF